MANPFDINRYAGVSLWGLDNAVTPTAWVPVTVSAGGGVITAGGGSGVYAVQTFTPAAGAYGAGDLISVAKQFTFVMADGVTGVPTGSRIRILTSIIRNDVTAVPAGQTSFTLQTYRVTPPSAQADNDAWTLASADLPSYLGAVALGTPVDSGAALFVRTGDLNVDMNLSAASFFGEYVTAGAATFAAVAHTVELIGILL